MIFLKQSQQQPQQQQDNVQRQMHGINKIEEQSKDVNRQRLNDKEANDNVNFPNINHKDANQVRSTNIHLKMTIRKLQKCFTLFPFEDFESTTKCSTANFPSNDAAATTK